MGKDGGIKSRESSLDLDAIPKLSCSDDLEGPDADNNGIRDDVDDYISNQFSESSQISAANQAARANSASGSHLFYQSMTGRS